MIKLMKKISGFFLAIPARVFLIMMIISGLICVAALRQNNQTMVQLRSAVYQADKDNKDVNQALNNLRSYVYSHMNTDLSNGNNNIKPPVQLKYTYERLVLAQENQLQVNNSQVYIDAQNYCKGAGDTSFDTACVQNYVVNHGGASTDANIPAALYQFDFVSPTWSPDLAGWSLIITAVLFALFILRLAINGLRLNK
jgi:preprotein translocase subunit SecF